MFPGPFCGVIQGLSEKKIKEIMKMKGLKENDYSFIKISIFRTSKYILTKLQSQNLEEGNYNVNSEKDYFPGLPYLIPTGIEELLVILTVLLAILIIFVLWVFFVFQY
jgi:hypothetical protein